MSNRHFFFNCSTNSCTIFIYELLLLKEKEENDPKFYTKDSLGRNVEVNVKSDKWTILHKVEYFYEEKFTVFGYDKRMETKEIIKLIKLKELNIHLFIYLLTIINI